MGVMWHNLSEAARVIIMDKIVKDQDFRQHNEQRQEQAREVSSFLYTLGIMGAKKETFPSADYAELIERTFITTLTNQTPQGLSNAMHGLARLGLSWADFTIEHQYEICSASYSLMNSMRNDEYCSILQSFALMKVSESFLADNSYLISNSFYAIVAILLIDFP